MAPKRKGPLQLIQRETDDIKKRVDGLLKDVRGKDVTVIGDEASQRCQELQTTAETTMGKLKKLTKADELAPVGNYDQRKQEEERRLQNIMERLNTLHLELSPPGPSTAAQDAKAAEKDNEDDEDEDDDDDEDEDEDDVDDDDDRCDDKDQGAANASSKPDPHTYITVCDFKGEQEGDLTVQKGEVLRILHKNTDGWWLAKNSTDNQGVVPKTYLKRSSRAGDDEEDYDDDDDDDTNHDEDFEDDDNDDDEEEEDDVGTELSEAKEKQSATHSNWSTVRKALSEIDATDVLSALGAIPSGFRPSTLNKLLTEEGMTYRGSRYIQPELSQSQLSFNDLFLDPDTGRVRARQVKTSLCFTLWSCRMIPTPGVGVQVLSRHIRLCAFDGTQVLSNIHTVRATYNPKSPKTWTFSPRMTGSLPTLLDGDCFLRCTSDSPDLGILFELGVTFIRNSTGERGDLSCGWAFLKLTDDSGAPLTARTYDLPVNGGTPYEKDVAVEPSVSRGTAGSVFHHMLQARKQPKLIVKLKSVNSRTRNQLSVLPDTFLYCLNSIHLLALHRQLLADTLLMDRPTMQTADLICSPLLATFPVLLDQPDLLDALRAAWLDAENSMSRSDKRDVAHLKQEFYLVYMSSVYPLLFSPSLPSPRWADHDVDDQRARVIYANLSAFQNAQRTPSQSGTLQALVDPTNQHHAFDITELTYDLFHMPR